MSDFLTRLGLRTSTDAITSTLRIPNYAPHFIIANFVFSYAVISTRFLKVSTGIDHNVNPREDIATYGETAVQNGKITREQLNRIKRLQAAHENAVEHFPFFVGALCMATAAGLDNGMINRYAVVYTAVRAAYAAAYYYIDSKNASWIRTFFWWSGNITCIRLLWFAGKALNVAKLK